MCFNKGDVRVLSVGMVYHGMNSVRMVKVDEGMVLCFVRFEATFSFFLFLALVILAEGRNSGKEGTQKNGQGFC